MSKIVNGLDDLYKKYFQNTNYKIGDSFDNVKSNMTGEDWDLSQKLLDYYGQQTNLTNNYNKYNENVDRDKYINMQKNAIAYEKAKKYLPQYLKSQGLGGLGQSQTSMIQARNNYNNLQNTVKNQANLRKDELFNNYQLNLDNLNRNASIDMDSIKDKYDAVRDNLAETERSNVDVRFNKLLSSDEKISKSDYEDLKSYVDGLKESIGIDNYNQFLAQLKNYEPYIRSDEEQKTYDNNSIIQKFQVGLGDTDKNTLLNQLKNNGGVNVHGTYGGGFTLDNSDLKIKEGDDGITLEEFVRRSTKHGSSGLNSGEYGWFGSENDHSTAIGKLATNGELANGTIVDTNKGEGQNMWIYLNGRFYELENKNEVVKNLSYNEMRNQGAFII